MSVKISGMVWDADLPRDAKYVLLCYADHADHQGNNVFPSVGLIAWKTQYSQRSVQRITRKLQELGILVPMGKGPHGVNRWRVIASRLPARPDWALVRPGVTNCRGDTHVTPGVPQVAVGGDIAMTPEPSLTINEPSLEDRPRKKTRLKPPTPEAVKVFRKHAHLFPAKDWYPTLADAIGTTPGSLEKWGNIVHEWVGNGWNPRNVKGMLDVYQHGWQKSKRGGASSTVPAPPLITELEPVA